MLSNAPVYALESGTPVTLESFRQSSCRWFCASSVNRGLYTRVYVVAPEYKPSDRMTAAVQHVGWNAKKKESEREIPTKGDRMAQCDEGRQTYNHGQIYYNENAGQLTRGENFELDLGLDIHWQVQVRSTIRGVRFESIRGQVRDTHQSRPVVKIVFYFGWKERDGAGGPAARGVGAATRTPHATADQSALLQPTLHISNASRTARSRFPKLASG